MVILLKFWVLKEVLLGKEGNSHGTYLIALHSTAILCAYDKIALLLLLTPPGKLTLLTPPPRKLNLLPSEN